MPDTKIDYEALAQQAAAEHKSANERYWKAGDEGRDAAFREVVFTAAAEGWATIKMESSDQGDWMYVSSILDAEGNEVDDDDDLLWAVSDLPDEGEPDWAKQPGVEATIDRRMGAKATIDVGVAAPAAAETLRQEWLAKAPEGVSIPEAFVSEIHPDDARLLRKFEG